ncbi:tubulin/FtsZ family protein [Halobellus litoreus]|uniref:Tubulin-like protein CetZ n=1 Tax=Halobellus litoreus TaxID=755310 RepID=A0ABD6DWT9_9EURY|nr:tubulin/FtsZ family protein [Halobellus litoreus]
MKIALLGVGQAGGKVADAILDYEAASRTDFVTDAVAINSARADLLGLRRIPAERRVLIGQSRVKGHGCGADNELGVTVAEEDIDEIRGAVDDLPVHEVDAFLVVAGLGGGTGSGASPVIARELSRLYTEPVYGLGVLPGSDEGGIYTLNAARSFQTFVREVDNLLVFDNDAWRRSGESLQGGYASINEEIARRLGVLLSAGEVSEPPVPESVVDASEIINTLAGGGVTTIGYANSRLDRPPRGLFGRREQDPDETDVVNRITATVRRATLGNLTLPANVKSTERALVVVSGPPKYLSRKGVEGSRRWLEEETGTMEVRGGDYPVPDSDYVSALVVLSGVTDVPRIKELQQIGAETQRNLAERAAQRPEALRDLVWDGDGEIDPLF